MNSMKKLTSPGDGTIYEPWGNVVIFGRSWSYSDDLIKIGHIDGLTREDVINVLRQSL